MTNGFITPRALDLIGPYLDSFRVDIKGFSERTHKRICHISDFEGILEVTKRAREKWGKFHRSLIPTYFGTGNTTSTARKEMLKFNQLP